MKSSWLSAALGVVALAAPACAQRSPVAALYKRLEAVKEHTHSDPDLLGAGEFDQLLDHKDPEKGTFKQRFWYDATHWKGQGSPVFLFNPGEMDASASTGVVNENCMPGRYAYEFGGAAIVIEHRYWGESIPVKEFTAETLQYLDLPQSIHDMTYFAQNVDLQFDNGDQANAPNSPWVLMGGSYSGALAAWTSVLDPDVFWAYHASSAVVEAIYDFHNFFDAIERSIPRNCSSDVKAVIQYVDEIFNAGDKEDIQELKQLFGLEMLERADDFAYYLASPLGAWQSNSSAVFAFCDYIETARSSGHVKATSSSGVGLDTALLAYAEWINQTAGVECKQEECSLYKIDKAILNNVTELHTAVGGRQWEWLLCHNPFSWWYGGPAKSDGTNIVSSLFRPEIFQSQCEVRFPTTNGFMSGSVEGFTAEHLNLYTDGWDADFKRVLFVNGEDDPWIAATVSAPNRPGGPRNSTDDMQVIVVEKGGHTPDIVFTQVPAGSKVVEESIAVMKKWLAEWTAPTKD